jgi:hypothetical protein
MKRMIELLLTAALAASCVVQGLSPGVGPASDGGLRTEPGMIVLGDRLEDPYTVENMSRALAALYPTKADRVVLPATHLYVRFLPADELQYTTLERLGVEMLDHPVDYEIVREGDWYHDPGIEPGQITWQYAVVGTDFAFPRGIRCEVIDKCYIPAPGPSTKADGIDWAEVEREAYRRSGNAAMLSDGGPLTKSEETGTPEGRITIVDPALGGTPEGVRGVRVSCHSFVKFAHAYTDAEGYYRMETSYASQPRYRLVFKNASGFAIGFNLILTPSSYSGLGKGEAAGMDLEVTPDSDRRLYSRCVVNNAGYDYYKGCLAEEPLIKTPPGNLRVWLFQGLSSGCSVMMQQGILVDRSKLGEWLGEFSVLLKVFLPDVTLGLNGWDSYADIYTMAIHEFAHTSHFMLAGRDYWENYVHFILRSFVSSGFVTYGVGTEEDHGYCEVGEMWAYYCESVFHRKRYGGEASFGMGYWFHPQIFLQLEDRGLNARRIFQVLGADVTDRTVLQKKLVSFYPEYKSAINQAFMRYN